MTYAFKNLQLPLQILHPCIFIKYFILRYYFDSTINLKFFIRCFFYNSIAPLPNNLPQVIVIANIIYTLQSPNRLIIKLCFK